MNNPPAFPRTGYIDTRSGTLSDGDEVIRHENGMTLRDYFAAAALQGMLCNGFMPDQCDQGDINVSDFSYSKAAFQMADAMLKAREE